MRLPAGWDGQALPPDIGTGGAVYGGSPGLGRGTVGHRLHTPQPSTGPGRRPAPAQGRRPVEGGGWQYPSVVSTDKNHNAIIIVPAPKAASMTDQWGLWVPQVCRLSSQDTQVLPALHPRCYETEWKVRHFITLRYDRSGLIRPGWPPVGVGGEHMGKTNLFRRDLVRCATNPQQSSGQHSSWNAHVKSEKSGPPSQGGIGIHA